ncbi:MAG: hypothetical protein AAGB13_08840 [Cyanobacteria bacterium P01_F01_bin.33]
MASHSEVKAYLACWLQLGKAVDAHCQALPDKIQLESVLGVSAFSPEFEQVWRAISARAERCYLEGTNESIADLLSDRWAITDCSRCGLHIPVREDGQVNLGPCPCADMTETWPNTETLPPRCYAGMVDPTVLRLHQVRDRLEARVYSS